MDFYDYDHARARLNGSVLRYKGRPVYIHSLNLAHSADDRSILWKADMVDLLTSRRLTSKDVREDKHLDFSPVPLGFTSDGGVAMYVTRRPSRIMKQGLSDQSITAIGCVRADTFTQGLHLRSKALGNAIQGMHCDLPTALERLNRSGETSFPLSRNWAISKGNRDNDAPLIHYKFYGPVGTVEVERKEIVLNDDWTMLNETLHEEYLNVAYN